MSWSRIVIHTFKSHPLYIFNFFNEFRTIKKLVFRKGDYHYTMVSFIFRVSRHFVVFVIGFTPTFVCKTSDGVFYLGDIAAFGEIE